MRGRPAPVHAILATTQRPELPVLLGPVRLISMEQLLSSVQHGISRYPQNVFEAHMDFSFPP